MCIHGELLRLKSVCYSLSKHVYFTLRKNLLPSFKKPNTAFNKRKFFLIRAQEWRTSLGNIDYRVTVKMILFLPSKNFRCLISTNTLAWTE